MEKTFRLQLPSLPESIGYLEQAQREGREITISFNIKDIKIEHLPVELEDHDKIPIILQGTIDSEVLAKATKPHP